MTQSQAAVGVAEEVGIPLDEGWDREVVLDWLRQAPSTVLAVDAWQNIGMKNKMTGYGYSWCQRSYRLDYFLTHVDDIADDCGLADFNSRQPEERVDYLLDKLDKLTHGDKAASDHIVAECFPVAWAIFRESQQPAQVATEDDSPAPTSSDD